MTEKTQTTSERRRSYDGPEFLKQGFRPFFLFAALWAVFVMGMWIGVLTGLVELASAFSPVDWHVHELLFGYTSAVIAGFLLTAVPNWTGRFPISGWPLFALFSIWAAGRVVILFSALLDPLLVTVVDVAFPLVLAAAIARELIAGKNWRNLRVLVLLVLFGGANLWFHVEVAQTGVADNAIRLGLSAVLVLIMVIGGRVIPSFTRNWLARRSEHLPVPFGRFDGACLGLSAVALLIWSFSEMHPLVPYLLGAAGLLNIARLFRWKGFLTLAEPLVTVLHVGFLFIPLGFIAMAVALVWPDLISHASAMHLWTAGAVGMMTMAIMTRASLGHTGQKMQSDWKITAIYMALFLSVVLRFLVGSGLGYTGLLHASATLWMLAYVGFVVRYAPSFFGAKITK